MSEQQGLGELRTVENTESKDTEASNLLVGWVRLDGHLQKVAFTKNELKRPIERAGRNEEDMPTLEAKPLDEGQIDVLKDEIERLKNRGLWARIFNL